MIHEGVAEALHHIVSKAAQLIFRQIQRRQQLLVHHAANEGADDLVLTGIADNVQSSQEGHRREHGVRTVEQRHLTLMVGRFVVREDHMQPCLISRELAGQLFQRQIGRSLDDPEMEGFRLNHHLVSIAHLLLNGIDIFTREARHDAIHECGADVAGFLKPLTETIKITTQFCCPQRDILADAIHEVMTVLEDELAGEDNQTLRRVAIEGAEAVVEQLGELGGVGGGRCVVQAACRVKGDACLGGVRDDEADVRLCG